MKAYLLTVLVIDLDELGGDGITEVLENTKYPNYCIAPTVVSSKTADLGEWSDDHPLNKSLSKDVVDKFFPSRNPPSPVC